MPRHPTASLPIRRALLLSPLAAWLPPLRASDQAGARVALVIGNGAYPAAALVNPTRDARAMSSLLRAIGFQVVEARDAGKAQMQAALAQTRELLEGQRGVGMLYYAGHGVQLDWRNYMLPVDVQLQRRADVAEQAVDVQTVLAAFASAATRINILVLDACRDNPFPAAASAKGLAPLDAPPGTFFAYATAPGNVAEDGSTQDGNGLYTRYLLQELQRKEARIEDVFKRVRLQVRQASQGRQIPWESTSLEDDFVFATGQRAEAAAGQRRDADFDAEMAAWERIKASTRAEDFYAFLQQHPSGRISEIAQFRLDQLARPAVQAVQAVKTLPAGVDRFRVGDTWAVQRTDFLAGTAPRQLRSEVTSIEGGRVFINGGEVIVDQMGGMLLNRFGAKDPAVLNAPAELQVGKRWRSAFTNTRSDGVKGRNYYDHRVTALEEIEVPAGRFKAFRVEALGEAVLPMGKRVLQSVQWIDPATMCFVRLDTKHTSSDRGERVHEHSSDVLLWRKQVPRA